jgi:hypothetical protein
VRVFGKEFIYSIVLDLMFCPFVMEFQKIENLFPPSSPLSHCIYLFSLSSLSLALTSPCLSLSSSSLLSPYPLTLPLFSPLTPFSFLSLCLSPLTPVFLISLSVSTSFLSPPCLSLSSHCLSLSSLSLSSSLLSPFTLSLSSHSSVFLISPSSLSFPSVSPPLFPHFLLLVSES